MSITILKFELPNIRHKMNTNLIDAFYQLKKELESEFKKHHPECMLEITEWRQKEINQFQNLMLEKVNGRISEKWFYTHIKNKNNEKLPRIDTLNLLCEFIDFEGWDEYVQSKGILSEREEKGRNLKGFSVDKRKKLMYSGIVMSLVLLIVFFVKTDMLAQKKYSFCFVNTDSDESLNNLVIDVTILHENQSNEIIKCNNVSCFEYVTDSDKIKFAVSAPYFKNDTIIRYLNSNKTNETIKLKPDDYALMIHVFSLSKIDDWEKRREQLDDMIADNAKIIQLDYQQETGIEMYNKQDFINKLTMPINSLKNLKIIKTIYQGDKIKMMRFVEIENSN